MKAHHPVRILLCALMLRACAGFAASAPAAAAPASQPAAPAVGASELQRVPPLYTAPNNQIRYGNAALFRNLIPSSTLEAQAGAEYADLIRDAQTSRDLLGNDNALVQRSRAILNKEIPFALKWNDRAKDWKWDLNVVRSNDIRMYCLPGGKIVIYSGLITRLHLNDNELGMMIGHDIAHALREHARERLGRQQAAQLSTGAIPQLFGFIDLGSPQLGIGEQLLAMRYSAADETEADVIGSEIASRAGYDPRAVVTLWRKIDAATRHSPTGFIWMHPYNARRRADLLKRLPDMMPLYAKAIGKTVDQLPSYEGMGRFQKSQF